MGLSVCAHDCAVTSCVHRRCQKKLTGDEGWRESETHWAVNVVRAAGSPWHKKQLPRTSLPSSP